MSNQSTFALIIFMYIFTSSSALVVSNCKVADYGEHGYFKSRNYPDEYPSYEFCYWNITTDPGHKIQLRIQSHFKLEGGDGCRHDHIIIDGLKYCGNIAPPVITSSSNTLYVEFRSDRSVAYSGFSAEFFTNYVEPAPITTTTMATTPEATTLEATLQPTLVTETTVLIQYLPPPSNSTNFTSQTVDISISNLLFLFTLAVFYF